MKPNDARLLIEAHAFDTGGGHLGFWKTEMIDCPQLMTSINWKSCSLTSLAAERAHPRRRHKGGIFKSVPFQKIRGGFSEIHLIYKSPLFI
jgi:hypothetical protein